MATVRFWASPSAITYQLDGHLLIYFLGREQWIKIALVTATVPSTFVHWRFIQSDDLNRKSGHPFPPSAPAHQIQAGCGLVVTMQKSRCFANKSLPWKAPNDSHFLPPLPNYLIASIIKDISNDSALEFNRHLIS